MALQYNFDTYIAQYLQAEGECALPQFGVLRVKRQSAQWQNKQLAKPTWHIIWDAEAPTNNNLIQQLAADTNTSPAMVEKAYTQWLTYVQQFIVQRGHYSLAELGTWHSKNTSIVWETSKLFEASNFVTWPTGLTLNDNANTPNNTNEEVVEPNSNNTWLYIALALLMLILAGGLYWYNQNNANEPKTEPAENITQPVVDTPSTMSTPSTTTNTADTVTTPSTTGDSNRYDVVVYQYSSEQRAQKQANKFLRNLNDSRVVLGADSQYLVIIRAVTTQTDTQRVVDSIRCFFNPKGRLYILK